MLKGYMNYNINLTYMPRTCILPPGWGAISNRNHISHFSDNPGMKSILFKKLAPRYVRLTKFNHLTSFGIQ